MRTVNKYIHDHTTGRQHNTNISGLNDKIKQVIMEIKKFNTTTSPVKGIPEAHLQASFKSIQIHIHMKLRVYITQSCRIIIVFTLSSMLLSKS
jgi:hypothetical protein